MEYQKSIELPGNQEEGLSVPFKIVLRGLNYLIDRVLSNTLFVIIIFILIIAGYNDNFNKLNGYLLFFALYFAVLYLYYFLSEAIFSKTPGKFITQTQVISEQGAKPTLPKIALRTLSRAIPFDELSVFVLKGNTFHDKISKTDVNLSRLLPTNLQLKRPVNILITTISILAFTPVFVFIIWVMADDLVSGGRIDLPNNMPADMSLVKVETITKYDSDYTELTYQGDGRVIKMTWLIAGFDFDSDELCGYMSPTALSGIGYEQINKKLECQILNAEVGVGSGSWRDIIKTNQDSIADLYSAERGNVADYYLYKPPNRLNIKAVSGELSEVEVLDMYNGGYTEVTYKDLESITSN